MIVIALSKQNDYYQESGTMTFRPVMRKYSLLLIGALLLNGLRGVAQNNTLPGGKSQRQPTRFLTIEKGVGVVSEIDFVNGMMGLSVCRGKFLRGTPRVIAGTGYQFGIGYDTDHQITCASFGTWGGFFKRKFGGQVGMRAMYYVKQDVQSFALRPEAGIGFVKAQLSYGYNIFFEKQPMELATHTLTLSVYFAVYADKVRMY